MARRKRISERNENGEQEESSVKNERMKRIIMTTIIGTVALLVIIVLLAVLSEPVKADPILDIDIQNGANLKTVYPDTTVTWSTSTNDGVEYSNSPAGTAGFVNLTLIGLPQYWTYSISPDTQITLLAGQTKTSTLQIYAPPNATAYAAGYTITVRVYEYANPNNFADTSVTVKVGQEYGVDLTPEASSRSIDPGFTVTFNLTVFNDGNGVDTINMTFTGTPPAWICYFNKDSITIQPFSNASAFFSCYVPPGELESNYPFTLTATSEDASYDQSISLQVRVNQVFDVSLGTSTPSKDIPPAETLNYTVTLINEGNGEDTFTISASQNTLPAGWTIQVPSSVPNIDAGSSTGVLVWLTASPDALKDEIITFWVNATTGDLSYTFPLQLNARVLQVHNVAIKGITLSQTMAPGAYGIYKVNITNTGNGLDTINLDIFGLPGDWPLPSPDLPGELDPDEYTVVEINVTSDSDALNQNYFFYINVSSAGDPSKTGSKTATAYITQVYEISLIILQATKFAEPEQQITFTMKVTNDGNGEDDIVLEEDELTLPSGWVTAFSQNPIPNIDAGETVLITYYITPAEDAAVGANLIKIYANSSGDPPPATDFFTVDVEIKQVFKVVVNTADSSNTVEPEATTTYNLTVRNDGTGEDDFELDYYVDTGMEHVLNWVSLEDPAGNPITSLTLAAGQKGYVIMMIVVPTVSQGGQKGFYNVTLTASSLGNTSISAFKTTKTQIIGVFEVIVSATTTKGEGAPGDGIVYKIFIQNTGTEDDTFDLNKTGEHTAWVEYDTTFPWVVLSAGETAVVNVTIEVPLDWEQFGYFDTIISALSRGNTSISGSLRINTTITQVFEVELQSPDLFKAAKPDQQAYYVVEIWNTGTVADEFQVEVPDEELYAGWVSFNRTLVTVQAGEYALVNVTITVDNDAVVQDDDYEINITVVSNTEESSNNTIKLSMEVLQVYEVEVTAYDDDIDGDPDTDITYVITVRNLGNGHDRYSITSDSTWVKTIERSNVELDPDEEITFNVTVHIPASEPVGDNKIHIIATSNEDPAKINDTIELNVGVNPIYDLEITGSPSQRDIRPGTSFNFTVIVENKGTGDDTIKFAITGIHKDWAKLYSGSTEQYQLFVEAGNISTMRMEIIVPADELEASGIIFTVNATSKESTTVSVSDTEVFSVNVDQSYDGYMTSTDPSQTTPPDEFVEFTIQIHNKGNADDQFLMSIENKRPGWTYTFDGQPNPVIGPVTEDSFVTTNLRATPDVDEVEGIYGIIVRATSQGDASVFFNYTVTVTIEQKFQVELQSSGPSTRDVDIEGGSTIFFVKVYNRGNGADTLSLAITSDQDYWIEMSQSDVTPGPNDFTLVKLWVNISSRSVWAAKNSPDPISIDIEVTTPGDSSPTEAEGTKDVLTLTGDIKPIYGVSMGTPSPTQDVEIGSSAIFDFSVVNEGITSQNYKVTTESYDSTNLSAPIYNPSQNPFPSTPTPNDVTLQMTVQPKTDAIKGVFIIRMKIVVNQDEDVKYLINVTVNIKGSYGVQLRAQNDETNKETLINTPANYTLVIKNLGNTLDRFYISATGDYTNLVSFEAQYVTLGPEQSAFVICQIFTDQPTIEANNLYQSGVPSTIRVSSENDTNEFATVTLDTDITVTHAHSLSSPDPKKDIEPGDTADFILYLENTGTTSDKYVASVVAFNTSALDNPSFDLGNPFPSSSVAAGTSTTLHVFVDVLDLSPSVPIGAYNITIRISIDGFPAIYKDYTYLVNVKQVYSHTLEAVDDSKEADVDESVEYTVTVKNTGNGPETFTVRATGDYSSLVTFSMTEVVLNQSEAIDIDILVYTDQTIIDRDDLYGTDLPTPIEVVSKNDPDSYSVEVPINTRIKLSYAFEFTSPQTSKEGKPGDLPLDFTIQVRNTGTATDTYSFRITGMEEEVFKTTAAPAPISNVPVEQYRTTTFSVTITTEKRLAIAGTYEIELTTDSDNDAGVSHSLKLYVIITSSADVEVTSDEPSDSGEPGEVVEYTVRISNKGNDNDTFDLTLTGPNKDWGEIYDFTGTNVISQVSLAPTEKTGAFTDVKVKVSIPGSGETEALRKYDIVVQATSKNTEGVSATETLSTEVETYVELELEYSGAGSPTADYNPNKSPPKFTFRVTNNGNVDEDGLTITFPTIPSSVSYSEPIIEPMAPGKSTTFTITFEIDDDREDDLDLEMYISSSADATYDSNALFIQINITKPNLFISDVTGLESASALKDRIDSSVTVSVTVTNGGTVKAENVQVKFTQIIGSVTTVKGTKTITSINPGQSKDISFRWTAVAEDVEFLVEITPLIETELGDNDFEVEPIDLRPDLAFTGEKLNLSAAPRKGETITLKALVRNTGGNAEGVLIKFYDGSKIIGSEEIDIDYDNTGEATVNWDVPDKEGETIDLKVEIDLPKAKGDGDKYTRSVKVEGESADGIAGIFEGAGLLGMGIGLGIGIILFIIGLVMGRGSAGRRREAAGGPSFAAFEKEEGLGKGAAKGPEAAPAPFGAPPGEEGEAPPGEEEEAAAPKEAVRVRCPKCGKVKEVTSTQRPLQIPCECGTTLMLKK